MDRRARLLNTAYRLLPTKSRLLNTAYRLLPTKSRLLNTGESCNYLINMKNLTDNGPNTFKTK